MTKVTDYNVILDACLPVLSDKRTRMMTSFFPLHTLFMKGCQSVSYWATRKALLSPSPPVTSRDYKDATCIALAFIFTINALPRHVHTTRSTDSTDDGEAGFLELCNDQLVSNIFLRLPLIELECECIPTCSRNDKCSTAGLTSFSYSCFDPASCNNSFGSSRISANSVSGSPQAPLTPKSSSIAQNDIVATTTPKKHESTGTTAQKILGPMPHPDFSFDDGNITLQVYCLCPSEDSYFYSASSGGTYDIYSASIFSRGALGSV